MNPCRFEHSPGSTSGNNTGTGRSGHHQNTSGAEMPLYFVRDSLPFNDRHLDKVLLCLFYTFTDSFRNLIGLTQAISHIPAAIANDNESGEAEPTSTFNNFCNTVDVNNP